MAVNISTGTVHRSHHPPRNCFSPLSGRSNLSPFLLKSYLTPPHPSILHFLEREKKPARRFKNYSSRRDLLFISSRTESVQAPCKILINVSLILKTRRFFPRRAGYFYVDAVPLLTSVFTPSSGKLQMSSRDEWLRGAGRNPRIALGGGLRQISLSSEAAGGSPGLHYAPSKGHHRCVPKSAPRPPVSPGICLRNWFFTLYRLQFFNVITQSELGIHKADT